MDFLREILTRAISKSPRFFVILQVAMAIMFVIGLIPSALSRWFDFEVGVGFRNFAKDMSLVAGGSMITSKLAVRDKDAKMNEGKMPFSDKKDKKPDQ